ncbi:nitrile hydratase accessory protein [Pseudonocardia sp. N23]|uniref:nitrile hydratase accessory protein n=1 Tax=Pseudonocardia sp. N23 TaxID=1987376 RepID=UPI000C022A47|nr:nitrile hydratase accessory protein [Pseudonocardia sp. N23]GAY08891.1 cobalt-containing nitrile hydratase subunit alpha [Pseudonocardia sp. N23]
MSTALNPAEHLDAAGSRIEPALRTAALEQLLTERGLVDRDRLGTSAPAGTAAGPFDGAWFAEPWESRAFDMATSLHGAGLFAWPQFQAALTARIAAWEDARPAGEAPSYFMHWLGAFEDVLAGDGTVFTDEIVQRAAELALRGHS